MLIPRFVRLCKPGDFCAHAQLTCDGCGEKKTGKQHKAEVEDKEFVFCDDCQKELEEAIG